VSIELLPIVGKGPDAALRTRRLGERVERNGVSTVTKAGDVVGAPIPRIVT